LRGILRRAGAVPDRTDFPLLGELTDAFEALAARHPTQIAVRQIGTSRRGEPLKAYTIGRGRLSHLVVGGVHPNEPIGSWTALHLTQQLMEDPVLSDRLDAKWSIIPCVDPDGYRLNEGWLANPGDRADYARHFFRPAPDEQVEWTFPFSYKKAHFDRMLPETKALRDAIDLVRPDLYVPLHNSEMGGVYYYLSRDIPALHEPLRQIPRHLAIPLNEGEPEAGYLVELAPAIFAEGSLEDVYDWFEERGLDPFPPGSAGNSSGEYAARVHGALCLIAELPYWRDERVQDTRPTEESYADLLERTGRQTAELAEVLAEAVAQADGLVDWRTPLAHGARAFAQMMSDAALTTQARAREPQARRLATAAERFGCEDTVRMFRLRYGGMMARAVRAAIGGGRDDAALTALADRLDARCREWCDEAAACDQSEPIPIRGLIGVQYGAILAAASHLAGWPEL
jgi:hypothetical protein